MRCNTNDMVLPVSKRKLHSQGLCALFYQQSTGNQIVSVTIASGMNRMPLPDTETMVVVVPPFPLAQRKLYCQNLG